MSYFLITTCTGDTVLVVATRFADFDDLYSKIGIEPDDVISIERYFLKEL